MKVFTRSLVFCLFIVQSLNGKLDEIVEQESASRKSINMSFENYQSYPFGISDGKKQFVLTFPSEEKIQGEIFLYWTDGNSSLVDPYQSDIETQFVTLTIKATETGETIAFKKFHTQVGFSFTAYQLKNYKIEFENHGIHPKMIDFSISYITPQKILEMSDVATWIEKSNAMSGHLLKQLQGIFNLWEQIMIVNQNEQHSKQTKIHQLLFSCLWEVLVIITLGIIQIYMFKKLMNDVSFV